MWVGCRMAIQHLRNNTDKHLFKGDENPFPSWVPGCWPIPKTSKRLCCTRDCQVLAYLKGRKDGVSRAEHGTSQLMSLSLAQKIWNAMREQGLVQADVKQLEREIVEAWNGDANSHTRRMEMAIVRNACCLKQDLTDSPPPGPQMLGPPFPFPARNTPVPKASAQLGTWGSLVPWRCP